MVYLIVDSERKVKPMLVKASNSDEVGKRLNLTLTQEIAGHYTDNEIHALETASFAVVSD